MFKKILQEPLLHFVVVGSFIFLILSNNEATTTKPQVIISKGKINQLTSQFTKTRQRIPSSEELTALINNQVREDLAFKHGAQMGLVENDAIIKRRVQQKLEFMLSDSIASIKPTKKELQDYLNTHEEKFYISPGYSFKHIYINPQLHENTQIVIANLLTQDLDEIYQESGDSMMLASEYSDVSSAEVSRLLGQTFANNLDVLTLNKWQGPVVSGYGLHVVRIDIKIPSHVAKLNEVLSEVKRDYRIDKQQRALESFYQELQTQYRITVEK